MRGVTLFEITDGQIVAGRLYMEDVERDVTGIEQAVEDLSGRSRPRAAQRSGGAAPRSHRSSGCAPNSSALTCRRGRGFAVGNGPAQLDRAGYIGV